MVVILIKKQIDTTKDVLKSIHADHIERILILTKEEISLTTPPLQEDYIFISNRTGKNIDQVIQAIYGHIYKSSLIHILKIPFDQGNIYNKLKENNTILETKYEDDGTLVKTILTPDQAILYKSYIVNKSAL